MSNRTLSERILVRGRPAAIARMTRLEGTTVTRFARGADTSAKNRDRIVAALVAIESGSAYVDPHPDHASTSTEAPAVAAAGPSFAKATADESGAQ